MCSGPDEAVYWPISRLQHLSHELKNGGYQNQIIHKELNIKNLNIFFKSSFNGLYY